MELPSAHEVDRAIRSVKAAVNEARNPSTDIPPGPLGPAKGMPDNCDRSARP